MNSHPQKKNAERFLVIITAMLIGLVVTGGLYFNLRQPPTPPTTPAGQVAPVAPSVSLEAMAAETPWPQQVADEELARSDVHRFTFVPPGDIGEIRSVAVAGSFNNWSKTQHLMQPQPDGTWHLAARLSEGVVYYKFVVNEDKWLPDTRNSDKELEVDDTFGGKNSAAFIGTDYRRLLPAKPEFINKDALQHNPASTTDADAPSETSLRLSLRTLAGDVDSVRVFYQVKGESTWQSTPMYLLDSSMGRDRYTAQLEPSRGPVRYVFELTDGKLVTYLAGGQLLETLPLAARVGYVNSLKPAFTTPSWARHVVWYQIFPERFRNGDSTNDNQYVRKWTSDWWATLPSEKPGEENFYRGAGNVWGRWFGGDIQGIQQQLPYLRKLGVTAIYLNPIFAADSQHKYDTRDYRHIDDGFGVKDSAARLTGETEDPATWQWSESDKVFLAFVQEAHRQGFKVIVDGVFNHVGRSHPFFQDVLKNGKNSKYADWFDVRDWNDPVKYIAWDRGGDPSPDGALPVFKKNEKTGLGEGPKNHIFAITRRWLAPDGDPSKGVDGFRLDVPGDIPHPFWIEWHKVVKGTKPDAYISGEIWEWAQPWLSKGDQFDAVMNYRFASACQEFFVNQAKAISPTVFNQRCQELINNYPQQVAQVQMNLFDSHDTDRFASMFVNPDFIYDASNRIQDNNPKYSPAKPNEDQWLRMKQAVAFQMFFVGAPMIYYGDEAGMWGPDDPSNRQPMIWKDLEPYDNPEVSFRDDLFNHYQRAIAIRAALPALRTGSFRPIKIDDSQGTYAFAREKGSQRVYVVVSRSAISQEIELPLAGVRDGASLIDYMNPESTPMGELPGDANARPTLKINPSAHAFAVTSGKVKLSLPAYGTMVLVER